MDLGHSKRSNLGLGNRVVQPNQCILRQNDEYKICSKMSELSKYVKRGGKRGGRVSPEAHKHWGRRRKSRKSLIFPSGIVYVKGGA